MTLVASFIGVDCKFPKPKPASIYIVSDSRIAWGDNANYDFGRKVFGCKNSPDIFGYCGDVLFPSIVLNQIVDIADQGLLFQPNWTCKQKFQAVINKLIQSFTNYPSEVANITANTFQIIHASRDKEQNFFCQKMEWWKSTGKWTSETVEFNDHSDKLFVIGSGRTEFLETFNNYAISDNQKTSRAVFHCFTDTLLNMKDKYCGGAPQLVGLYRIGNSRFYGIIHNSKRYLQGVQVDDLINFNNVEWRNNLFEVCDGTTMKIKNDAQRQPNPLLH
ncbi:MAG: hypothetical protein ACLQQ4_13590 [Bacteroidia bacterium]